MEIKLISDIDELWELTIQYAKNCSWGAGYCTLAKTDCIPDVLYTPYIGYVFVGENFRGNRISEKLILHALEYAKTEFRPRSVRRFEPGLLARVYVFAERDGITRSGVFRGHAF